MIPIRISSRLSRLLRFRVAHHTCIRLLGRRRIALFRHGANGIRPRGTVVLGSQCRTTDGAPTHHRRRNSTRRGEESLRDFGLLEGVGGAAQATAHRG